VVNIRADVQRGIFTSWLTDPGRPRFKVLDSQLRPPRISELCISSFPHSTALDLILYLSKYSWLCLWHLHRHDAGYSTSPELRAPKVRSAAFICDWLIAILRNRQEPPHQQRYKGAVSGLHGKAGLVSGTPGIFARRRTDRWAASMPNRQLSMVCAAKYLL
jgi:hypothetical protein